MAGATGIPVISNVGQLIFWILNFVLINPAVKDVNAITGSNLAGWHILIPFYNWYWAIVTLRGEMVKAKERSGSKTPARGGVWYFFFPVVAAYKDLNDIAEGK